MPKLPLVGDVPKGWLIAVGVGSVAVLGYVYVKHKQSAAAATGATVTDPAGNVCSALNPSTGYCPGTPQDLAAMGQGQYGFGGSTGGGTVNPPAPTPSPSGPGTFTNNAQWATYVEQALSFTDPNALSAAIGVYLTGRPATPDQVSLIDQAIAIGGYPPIAGVSPAGYPPNIMQQKGPGGGGGKVTVPNCIGSNWTASIKKISAAGLKPSPGSKPSNAKDPITGQSPAAGTKVDKGSTVTLTSPTR